MISKIPKRSASRRKAIDLCVRSYPHWHEADFCLIFYPHSHHSLTDMTDTKGRNFLRVSYNVITHGIDSHDQLFFIDSTSGSASAPLLLVPSSQVSYSKPFELSPLTDIIHQYPVRHLGMYLPQSILQRSCAEIAKFLSEITHQACDNIRMLILLTTFENQAALKSSLGDLSELKAYLNHHKSPDISSHPFSPHHLSA